MVKIGQLIAEKCTGLNGVYINLVYYLKNTLPYSFYFWILADDDHWI